MTDEQKLELPETSPEIGHGFLAGFWQLDRPLTQIRGLPLKLSYLWRGVQTAWAIPLSNSITIMTIAVSLFLLAGALVFLQNVDSLVSNLGGTEYITAYLKNPFAEEELGKLKGELEANSAVRSVDYISKERALELFSQELGSQSSFLKGFTGENPLPASLEVLAASDDLKVGINEKISTRLRESPIVEEVVVGSDWASRVRDTLRTVRTFAYLALCVVLALSIFLIANTIKLVIFSRRDEIEIMQLVGASDSFIKIPFVIGGVLQGFLGAVLGLMLIKLAFVLFNQELHFASVLGSAIPPLSFIGFWGLLGIILLGMLVGALGSFFALGRFMNA